MRDSKYLIVLISFISICCILSCRQNKVWEGQAMIKKVSTETVPVQKQWIGTFDLGNGIYASNDFNNARLNGITLTNETNITALITPENTPINDSPWYAFKLWSDKQQQVQLKLTYLDGIKHRYYPNLSQDGINWAKLDSSDYSETITTDTLNEDALPDYISMNLTIGPDTLWISAQEIVASQHVKSWINELDTLPFVSSEEIGKSREGRSIDAINIEESQSKKMVIAISRQHPPEVTGYLAMEAFIETICGQSELANKFRKEFSMYVIPLVNPDGVDNGQWRHNMGGIDLNRDWVDFNQPETKVVHDFMQSKVANGSKFYFGVDFHSTYEDIYYTINPESKGNMPGLVTEMIELTSEAIEEYEANIRPRPSEEPPITSLGYFFNEYGAESLTYEIGDNTPRDLLKKKGETSAQKLMNLMLQKIKNN